MDETSDRLCAIDERTGLIVLEIGARWYWRTAPDGRTERSVLPLSSGVNVLPNTSAQITSRPQNGPFRPRRFIIGGTPGDWIVNDVRIGNRSQFSHSGDVPGDLFAAATIDSFVSFEMVQVAMDLVVTVTYVGGDPAGAPFVAAMLGEMVDRPRRTTRTLARRSAMRWTPEGRLQGWMIGLTGEDENRDLDPTDPRPHATQSPPAVEAEVPAPVRVAQDQDAPVIPRASLGAWSLILDEDEGRRRAPSTATPGEPGGPDEDDEDDSADVPAMVPSGS